VERAVEGFENSVLELLQAVGVPDPNRKDGDIKPPNAFILFLFPAFNISTYPDFAKPYGREVDKEVNPLGGRGVVPGLPGG